MNDQEVLDTMLETNGYLRTANAELRSEVEHKSKELQEHRQLCRIYAISFLIFAAIFTSIVGNVQYSRGYYEGSEHWRKRACLAENDKAIDYQKCLQWED